ncbi:2040_t:CDS:2 [Cetraspora pellucida]|uniref:2040_t:CDS:1 n=1 Tax=Cetraspora pellucida TaxID=1433469 RepID=A0A9N9NEJ1_9GLOM|nr:2040_t:CDS:2 [Cetraspora pellucida]
MKLTSSMKCLQLHQITINGFNRMKKEVNEYISNISKEEIIQNKKEIEGIARAKEVKETKPVVSKKRQQKEVSIEEKSTKILTQMQDK